MPDPGPPPGLPIHIDKTRSRGKTYHYARCSKRINGKPTVVWSLPLGTPDTIVKHYIDRRLDHLVFTTVSFGIPAALLTLADELDLISTIDDAAPKRVYPGSLSASQLLLSMCIGRSFGPLSKRATGPFLEHTFLSYLWLHPLGFDENTLYRQMDELTPEVVETIMTAIGKRLVALGHSPKILLYDPTNYSTCIENFGEKVLPQHGVAKDKRAERNLVGMSLAITKDELPVLHETYPGNEQDVPVFARNLKAMCRRLHAIGADTKGMVLVMDRGNNSTENIGAALAEMHLIGALNRTMAKPVLEVPLSEYRFLFRNAQRHAITAYRTKLTLWGREFVVVGTYNEQTAKRQRRMWEASRKKAEKGLADLERRFTRKGRGKKMTQKGAYRVIRTLVPTQYWSVFEFSVDEQARTFTWRVVPERAAALEQSFGRSVLFTDLTKWDTKRIVRTYHSRWRVEKAFHWLKDALLIPVPPIRHRKDERVTAHVAICVLAFLLVRYLVLRLELPKRVSDEQVLKELRELRVALVRDVETGEAKWMTDRMSFVQGRIFTQLNLGRYLRA